MKTEAELRFLLHHSNTDSEDVYAEGASLECLTVLENGLPAVIRTAMPCAIASDSVTHKAVVRRLT